jgi:hypothetical protein
MMQKATVMPMAGAGGHEPTCDTAQSGVERDHYEKKYTDAFGDHPTVSYDMLIGPWLCQACAEPRRRNLRRAYATSCGKQRADPIAHALQTLRDRPGTTESACHCERSEAISRVSSRKLSREIASLRSQ